MKNNKLNLDYKLLSVKSISLLNKLIISRVLDNENNDTSETMSKIFGVTDSLLNKELTKLKKLSFVNEIIDGDNKTIVIDNDELNKYINEELNIEPKTTFINKNGNVLNINAELVEFYNEKIINNSELINMLKTYKYDTSFNAALSQLKNLNK